MSDFKLDSVLVGPTDPIDKVLAVLNDAHRRIAIVVDDARRILGVVTDSNFRHAMLSRKDFGSPVGDIMTRSPITVTADMTHDQVLHLMERTHCHEVPVIDRAGAVTGLLLIEDLLHQRNAPVPRVAVIMAGGLGERLRPLTEQTPKPLVNVGGRPILFAILDHLLAAEFDRIVISVNYLAEAIVDAVRAVPGYARVVEFVREDDRMGTAGALTLLPELPADPFLVMNGDLLTNIDFRGMLRFHRHESNAVTIALREERVRIPYGVAQLEGTRVVGLREKPEYSHFINTGVYVVDPAMVSLLDQGTYSDMPTLIERAIAADKRVGCFPVHEYWLDIGERKQLDQADRDFGRIFPGAKAGPEA